MSLVVNVLSREIDPYGKPGTFELSIRWQLAGNHKDGLLIQKVARSGSESKLVGGGQLQTIPYNAAYWEAWEVINYQVYMRDWVDHSNRILIPQNSAHDTFASGTKFTGFGATRIQAEVFWLAKDDPNDDTALQRMQVGAVPDAAGLLSSYQSPLNGVNAERLLGRDEFFHISNAF